MNVLNKISVVIPYYNDSPVFDRCLSSLLKQNHVPYEVIIIDDCSEDSDKLIEIVKKYTSLNIKLHRNSSNKNGAYSRNLGLSIAKGDFVALLDADDYWLPNHLDSSLIGLIENDCDFVYSNVVNQKCNGEISVRKVCELDQDSDFPANILLMSPPQTNSFFFRNKVINNIRFDETLRRHQDFQFLLEIILSEYKCKYLDIDTAVYCESHRSASTRIHPDSIFKFWSERINLVDLAFLRRFLISNLLIISKIYPEKIDFYIDEYPCFDVLKSSFFMCVLRRFSGCHIFIKFFIIAYYNFFYDLKLIPQKIFLRVRDILNVLVKS